MSDSVSENVKHLARQIQDHIDEGAGPSSESKDAAYEARLESTRKYLREHPGDEYVPAMRTVRPQNNNKGIGRSMFYVLRKEIKAELKLKRAKKGSGTPGLVTRGPFTGQPLKMDPAAVAQRARYRAKKDAKAAARQARKVKKTATPLKAKAAALWESPSAEGVTAMLKDLTKTLKWLGYTELSWDPKTGWWFERELHLQGKI